MGAIANLAKAVKSTVCLTAVAAIVFSVALVALNPLLDRAYAAGNTPDGVEMAYGSLNDFVPDWNQPDAEAVAWTSCTASFTNASLDESTVRAALGPAFPSGVDASQHRYVPSFNSDFIDANKNQSVPVIDFHNSSRPGSRTTKSCNGSGPAGGRFLLIPVASKNGTDRNNANVWVGLQVLTKEKIDGTNAFRHIVMRFTSTGFSPDGKNTVGKLEYQIVGPINKSSTLGIKGDNYGKVNFKTQNWDNFVIGGVGKPTSSIGIGNISSGSFEDVSTIKIEGKINGASVTEYYFDPHWDSRHIYFLKSSTNVTRNNLSYNNQGGDPRRVPTDSPGSNRIPFIDVSSSPINISFSSSQVAGNLQKGVNSIGASSMKLYDYNPDGSAISPDDSGLPRPVELRGKINTDRASVWFYYSQKKPSLGQRVHKRRQQRVQLHRHLQP